MLFFITVSVLVVSANAVVYTDCGSKLATVQKVSVSGCAEDVEVCVLQRNTNATFSIDFTPNKEVTAIEMTVIGELLGVPLPFSQPQPDGCKDSGLTCPLPASQSASLQTIVPILQAYPPIYVRVIWELRNEDSEEITCVRFPAKIQ